MRKWLSITMSFLFVLSVFSAVSSYPTTAKAASTLTVDLNNRPKSVDHSSAGSLYGLNFDGQPAYSLSTPLHAKNYTQMAPGGHQLPNGQTSPSGDALVVANQAAAGGGTVTIRMPDWYPNFPYKWVSWTDWENAITSQVNATKASGKTNIYAYEIWNEPDGTWDTANAGPWLDGWKRSFQKIKSLDTTRKILGPGNTHYDHNAYSAFLTYAKANNVLPDVINWHELQTSSDIVSNVNDYRALEASLGISPRLIAVNEYGTPAEEGVPGSMVKYIAQFERAKVDTANIAFWHAPGKLSDLLVNNTQQNGGWWLYKWYGDMSGSMLNVTAAGGLDGAASLNTSTLNTHVIFGGIAGNNSVTIKNFASTSYGTTVNVKVEAAPWTGVNSPVSAPILISQSNYTVSSGQITIPVNNMSADNGYHIIVTNGSGSTYTPPALGTHYEAELGAFSHANISSSSSASNGKYVAQIDYSDSWVDFYVNVSTTKAYTMTVRYANGTGANSTQGIAYNGGAWGTITYPATAGWGQFGSVTTTVNLVAGINVIRLAKGSPGFAGGTGYAELDYIALN
jgi:hypothetical protein